MHAYHPEDEEAQQVPGSDPSARWQSIRNVIVSIAKDPSHEDSSNPTTIVSLRRKVDDSDDSSDQDVQTCSSDASSNANIDREADEVLDRTTTIQHDHNSQNCRAYDRCNNPVPPE